MMKSCFLVTVVTILLSALGTAHAASQSFSGTLAVTEYDGKLNTQPAELGLNSYTIVGNATINSNRRFLISGDIEFSPLLETAVHCPPERPFEYPILPGGMFTFTDANTQDVVFLTTDAGGYECDPADVTPPNFATSHESGTTTGGLGIYEHATGTFSVDTKDYYLRLDPEGHLFAADKGTITGTVDLH
ncbi:MAG: hypothetical protein HY268_19960 [Deltaproteobacteria bacterium]|nr:hypothetical protein [Deltaproteobacteria bacterium]